MAFLGQEEQLKEFQERFRFISIVILLGFIFLASRLAFLQIFQGDQFRRTSEENRIKRVEIEAPRGMIFDRNGTLLVDNRPAFDLEIIPQYLRESKQAKEVIAQLSKLIDMSEKQIRRTLRRAGYYRKGHLPFHPIKIKTDLSRDEVAKIETWKIAMPGVQVKMEIQRTTVFGDIASHLLGYIGKVNKRELPKLQKAGKDYDLNDKIGKSGIERQLEDVLRGTDGQEIIEVDALGRRIRNSSREGVLGKTKSKPAIPGKNVVLTIDQDLQLVAKEAFGDKVGGLVAIDPRTGEILAMISRPSYNPTEFARGISSDLWDRLMSNPNRPLRDKTIQDHYAPGSVFKVITAFAALEAGVINQNTKFTCTGSMRVGNRIKHCHGHHGEMDIVSALRRSCDIFFYRVAQKLKSVNEISDWAFNLGLGKKTDIDLPREVPGLIPTIEWKEKRYGRRWTQGETVSVAIGQSFVLTTVMQLANLYATIANGGTLFHPYYVRRVESHDGNVLKEFEPEIIKTIPLSEKTKTLVKKGLYQVVNHRKGTAFYQRLPGMNFAGKSGTAQVVRMSAKRLFEKCETFKYKFRHNAIFAGFAPVEDPVIAVAMIGEHACGGSSGAAPVVRAVIQAYLEKYFPEKYSEEAIAKRGINIKRQFIDTDNDDEPDTWVGPAPRVPKRKYISPLPQTTTTQVDKKSDTEATL